MHFKGFSKTTAEGKTLRRRREVMKVEYDGQTEFALKGIPADLDVMAQVNTVLYHPPHLSLTGRTVFWSSVDFKLDPEDDVAFYYYEE